MALDDTCFEAAHELVNSLYLYNDRYSSDQWALVIEALFPLNTVMSIHATPDELTPAQIEFNTKLSVLCMLCDTEHTQQEYTKIIPMLKAVVELSPLLKDAIDTFNVFVKTDEGLLYVIRNAELAGKISMI